MSSHPSIPIKSILGLSVVVFCSCETINLFSVVFCVVSDMHKFEFRLATNETLTNGHAGIQSRTFFLNQELHIFPRPSSPVLRVSTDAVQIGCILLSKGQYPSDRRPGEAYISSTCNKTTNGAKWCIP